MSSNSLEEYLTFCENLIKEHTSYLVPQFWEWLNTRSTEIFVTSGRPQCSYNSANQNQESYTSFSQNQEKNPTTSQNQDFSESKKEKEITGVQNKRVY